MQREIKIAILTIITIAGSILGYKFVKGQNLFQTSRTYYTTYDDVTALAVSSPVAINGLKVGSVTDIKLNPKDVLKMDVYFRIDGDYVLPKDTKILMKNEGLVGGKMLTISYSKQCQGNECAENGAYLEGVNVGLLGSLVEQSEVNSYVGSATNDLQKLLANVGKDGEPGKINEIVRNLNTTLQQMAALTKTLNTMMAQSNTNIQASLANVNKLTANLASNNDNLSQIMKNMNVTTKSLADANFGNTVQKSNVMIDNAAEATKVLKTTLAETNKAVNEMQTMLQKIHTGSGSLAKLMNDHKLYDNLTSSSKNLDLLLQDFRLNPKRYVNVSLIGRKDKGYTLPENDPAQIKQQ